MNLPLILLEKAAQEGKLAHLLIFHGGSTQTRREAGQRLAQVLNCLDIENRGPCLQCSACRKISSGNHPDVWTLESARLSIGIEQVLGWQERLYRKHYEGKYKVALVEQAEVLTTPAANALLKVVEEPPERTLIILSTQNAEGILPTVRSRAQSVFFPDPSEAEWFKSLENTDHGEAEAAYRLSGGTPDLAGDILEYGVKVVEGWMQEFYSAVMNRNFTKLFPLFPVEKKQALVLLQVMAIQGQQELGGQHSVPALLAVKRAIEEIGQQANPRLVMEVLALELFQQGGILCDRGRGCSF